MKSTTFENLPLLLTVGEMASGLRIGRNAAYQLVKAATSRASMSAEASASPAKP